ncbi:unnamed protein product [Ostreobium quekettii]|uniref:RCC1-like domain-containing protein n=1 Tax=Ostreobium quekettii TaxID=121088 RepID=A0A8S1IPJ6_9CHLO|nr:unnamed protein product [Ostreobium quekettii]|eukprot:evm.model.scf_98.8 EVM.evm.TU.scf_98.8   scf_98:67311-70469(+)
MLASATSPPSSVVSSVVAPEYVRSPPVECVVYGWGANEDGQLGLDGVDSAVAPRVIESLLGARLRGRDGVRCPLVGGSRVSLAICADGKIWSWGWNERGTIGNGQRGGDRKPREIAALKGVRIVQAAVGGWHCLAVTENNRVYAWGGNEYFQCGVNEEEKNIVKPTICVPHLQVKQVACGGMHSLALTTSGEVWTWGEPWGEFKLQKEKHPRPVVGATDILQIACGAFHNLALDRDGHVLTWGTNDYGQLGNGSTSYQTTPKRVVDLDDVQVSDVGAGGWHSIALTKEGDLYIWGRGEYGRLGLGDASGASRRRPQKVKGLEGHRIVQAAAGGSHTACLTDQGRMFIWGRGSFGRLGTGSLKDTYRPCEVSLPGGHWRWKVIAICCGGRHCLCLVLPVNEDRDSSGLSPSDHGGSVRDYESSYSEDTNTGEGNGLDEQMEERDLLSQQVDASDLAYLPDHIGVTAFAGVSRPVDVIGEETARPPDHLPSVSPFSRLDMAEAEAGWMGPPIKRDGQLREPVSEELGNPMIGPQFARHHAAGTS